MNIVCTIGQQQTTVMTTALEHVILEDAQRLYVTDEHVAPLLSRKPEGLLVLPSGEEHKRWESIERIIARALELGLGRDACFVGIGGGVICDMTAFAASIYMRGVSVDLVPTSLLAMVDASLGGKTGADFNQVKNIIGTFYPADHVYICTETLQSLPDHEYRNGLAELIKHGFLTGEAMVERLETSREALLRRDDPRLLEQLILESLQVKRSFIERDPREQLGLRAQLNLGHTFAHALETLSGFSGWSHGEAVAWGMARAAEAGVLIGRTPPAYARRVEQLLRDYGFRVDYRIAEDDLQEFLHIISHDKKKRSGSVMFVLQSGPGETVLTTLDESVVRTVVSSSRTV